jgi:hypothetical protein
MGMWIIRVRVRGNINYIHEKTQKRRGFAKVARFWSGERTAARSFGEGRREGVRERERDGRREGLSEEEATIFVL